VGGKQVGCTEQFQITGIFGLDMILLHLNIFILSIEALLKVG